MTTLPAPTTGNNSHTALSFAPRYATASVWQPGCGFAITKDGNFLTLTATKPHKNGLDDEVSIQIHLEGIPALVAEIQRLTQ